jgi:hypothetical protein
MVWRHPSPWGKHQSTSPSRPHPTPQFMCCLHSTQQLHTGPMAPKTSLSFHSYKGGTKWGNLACKQGLQGLHALSSGMPADKWITALFPDSSHFRMNVTRCAIPFSASAPLPSTESIYISSSKHSVPAHRKLGRRGRNPRKLPSELPAQVISIT